MKSNVFLLLALLSPMTTVTAASSVAINEKTYFGEELMAEWLLTDSNSESVGWGEFTDEGVTVYYGGGCPEYIRFTSKGAFYDISKVEILYTTSRDDYRIYPPVAGLYFSDADSELSSGKAVFNKPDGTTPMGQLFFETNLRDWGTPMSVTIQCMSPL